MFARDTPVPNYLGKYSPIKGASAAGLSEHLEPSDNGKQAGDAGEVKPPANSYRVIVH